MDQDTPENQKIKRTPKIPKRITEKYLYNSGLAYLQKFTSSIPNFERVMMRKIVKSCRHYTDQDMEACKILLQTTTEIFQRQGYLNDEAYIRGIVYSGRNRGLSSMKIATKLQQKGLPRTDIDIALHEQAGEQTLESTDFVAAIKTARRKKIGCYSTTEKDKNKEIASLARAGFSYDIAQKTLALSKEEAEALIYSVIT